MVNTPRHNHVRVIKSGFTGEGPSRTQAMNHFKVISIDSHYGDGTISYSLLYEQQTMSMMLSTLMFRIVLNLLSYDKWLWI